DTIIEEITAMTYPSVGAFLKTHVEGKTPINYNEFFEKAGLGFSEGRVKTNYIQNKSEYIFKPNSETMTIAFTEAVAKNSFWHENGVKAGDVVKTVDGVALTMATAQQILSGMYTWQPGKEIHVVLDRNGEEVVIKTALTQSYTIAEGLMPKKDATEKQNALRKAWLNK
ncbi:MAG: peptidase M61, partial [Oceanihabitans sp.]